MDVADIAGNVYIGYWASLKWKKIAIDGCHHLWRSEQKGIKTQTDIIKEVAPRQTRNLLIWKTNRIQAIWDLAKNSAPIKETLFTSDKGKIIWQCLQPKAYASIKSSNLSFSGLGYAECIDITLPVWDLPFNTLYWGRCHTDNHFLVWIKWSGQTNQNLVYFDNKRSQNFKIKKREIIGSGFLLKMQESFSLRQGEIASTVFRPFEKIVKIFPRKTFLANESKWYGRGILYTSSAKEPATIIYEKVTW
jgi:hypothetical protein